MGGEVVTIHSEQSVVGAARERTRETSARRTAYFGHEDAAHLLRLHQRYRATLRLLQRVGYSDLSTASVLDVGCGDGTMLCEYMQWGALPERLAGIDPRADRIGRARTLVPEARLVRGCASGIPWPDGYFDIVSAFTVFSSILEPEMRRRVAAEMVRVLRPGGIILRYDTLRENPHNASVRAVSIEEIRSLFEGLQVNSDKLTFLPHVARRMPVAALELTYNLLAMLPGCRSHVLAALVRE